VIRAAFAIPGDIDLPTGGYAYDRRVLSLLPACGVAVTHLPLPGSFPEPRELDLAETARLLASPAKDTLLLIDGLAYGALPASVLSTVPHGIVALVHHPLCLEAGLSPQRQAELRELEIAALAMARRVIVTSPLTARTLVSDFKVLQDKITVAEPGTDRATRAQGAGSPLHLLSVGSIVPRKAYHLLVEALAPLAALDWRLTIVGPADRNAEALGTLQRAIASAGLGHRIALPGAACVAELDAHYASADVFILPSLYEGYGMVLGEAMARGLPIICTTGGAAADTAPDAAAIKVAPGDVPALMSAIRRLLDDPALRRRMSDASWKAGQQLPTWQQTAEGVAGALRKAAA
jgi:glycosyltransferase involved in cell wall biosynthesis